MSKIRDEEYKKWIQEQFLKEAKEIEQDLEAIPDTEEWKPTEEKFQALMKRAREKGLFREAEASETILDDSVKKTNDNFRSIETAYVREKNQKLNTANFKRRVVKWTAYAAAIVVCVFSVSMTSQANRAYIMEEANKLFGNDVNTKVNNDKVLDSDRTEKYAAEDIENTLGVEIPRFHYMPSDLIYQDYVIDKEAQTAIFRYTWKDEVVYFRIVANIKSTSELSQSDLGEELGKISNEIMQALDITLWKVEDKNDEKPTFFINWEYKNSYYEFFGKLPKEEIEDVAEQLMY